MPRDESYLLYILVYSRWIIESTSTVSWNEFRTNREKQDSVILQIGNIGEAANHVSDEFRAADPEISWKRIIGMRHRMVHGYEQIKLEEVWKAARTSVPELIQQIEPLVPPEEEV